MSQYLEIIVPSLHALFSENGNWFGNFVSLSELSDVVEEPVKRLWQEFWDSQCRHTWILKIGGDSPRILIRDEKPIKDPAWHQIFVSESFVDLVVLPRHIERISSRIKQAQELKA